MTPRLPAARRLLAGLLLPLGLAACDPAAPEAPAGAPAEAPAAEAPAAPAADRVEVSAARVRAQPTGAPNSAAFVTLKNPGAAAALVGAEATLAGAPVAGAVELHTHSAGADGAMQMRQVDRIDLPAGGEVVLQPGGLHIMLIGLKAGLTEGATVDLTLLFDDGSRKALSVPVQPVDASMGAHAGHGGHGAAAGDDKACGCGEGCACDKAGGAAASGGEKACGCEGDCTCGMEGGHGAGHGEMKGAGHGMGHGDGEAGGHGHH
jgi:copper(I)-binding protein